MEAEHHSPMELENEVKGEKRWADNPCTDKCDGLKKNRTGPCELDRSWGKPMDQQETDLDEGLTGSDEWPVRRPQVPASDFNSEWGEEESPMERLSEEVLLYIFHSGLVQSDLQSISLVCRRWWALSRDRLLQQSLDQGKAFAVGAGQYGQLGLGIRSDQLERPAFIRTNLDTKKIVRVYAARRHSVVLDSEGGAYSFGSGEDGKLGHGDELDQLLPQQIMAVRNHKIIDASCGVHHTLLLCANGRLFSFGFAACGQLGHGDQSNRTLPMDIKYLANKQIVACAAGAHHSLAVSRSGQVYSFGLGHTGQLGHGDENVQLITYQLTPKLIESIRHEKIIAAAAGFFNSLLISEDGRVFSFGSGGNGKLGHGDQTNQLKPKLIQELVGHKVIQVSAGPCHTLALTADGKVFSFGNGQNGRLGHRNEMYSLLPMQIEALRHEEITAISAGECHSLALTKDGRVYFFGSMGSTSSQSPDSVPWLEASKHHRILGIAAGGTHSLFHT